jgi:hypothetical protein
MFIVSRHGPEYVTSYRASLTDREREVLSGDAEVSRNYVYQIRTRFRQKLEELAVDIEILEATQPDLLVEFEEVVCGRD